MWTLDLSPFLLLKPPAFVFTPLLFIYCHDFLLFSIILYYFLHTYTSKPVHMLSFFKNCLILLMFSCISLILFGNRNKWREVHEIKPCALVQLCFTGFMQFFFFLFKLQFFSHVFFCGSSVFKALATGLHVGQLRWLGSPWARIRGADPEFWLSSVGWI